MRACLPLDALADAIDARADPEQGSLTAAALQLVVADLRAAWRHASADAQTRLCRTCVLVFDLCSPSAADGAGAASSVDGARAAAAVPVTRVLGVLAALTAATLTARLALAFSIVAGGAPSLTPLQLAAMVWHSSPSLCRCW